MTKMVMKTYAAIYKNEDIRRSSSSGGVFSAIAEKFDVVYGIAMTEDCYGAEVIRTEHDIAPLRGSKYFQAKLRDSFRQVKKDLQAGKTVLFSGTGCQINGLKCFLGKEYDHLRCVDVICHGVPSPKLWKEYVKYHEKKHGKLKRVNFRCKDAGWGNYGMKKNQIYVSKNEDSFMQMFLRDYCLRPSCYECHAKNYKLSDLTIADFWGIEKVAPEMNDGRGTSLVIVRTAKGEKIFEEVKDGLKWKEVGYKDGVRNNPSEYSSVPRPALRNTFFRDLEALPFEEMEKKYASETGSSFFRKTIRKMKRIARKMLGAGIRRLRSNADYGTLLKFEK